MARHEGLYEETRIVVAQTNANGDISDAIVITIFRETIDTLKWEKSQQTMSPMEIFKTPSARRRLIIGMSLSPFSCICGNIIASYPEWGEFESDVWRHCGHVPLPELLLHGLDAAAAAMPVRVHELLDPC